MRLFAIILNSKKLVVGAWPPPNYGPGWVARHNWALGVSRGTGGVNAFIYSHPSSARRNARWVIPNTESTVRVQLVGRIGEALKSANS